MSLIFRGCPLICPALPIPIIAVKIHAHVLMKFWKSSSSEHTPTHPVHLLSLVLNDPYDCSTVPHDTVSPDLDLSAVGGDSS